MRNRSYKDDDRTARRRRSGRSTTTRSISAASRSRWSSPRPSKRRATRPRWSRSTTSAEPHDTDLRTCAGRTLRAASEASGFRRRSQRGDAEAAFAEAPVQGRRRVSPRRRAPQPDGDARHHRDLGRRRPDHRPRQEPGLAERPRLSRHASSASAQEDVRVLNPFVGGAFGSGLRPQYQRVPRGDGRQEAGTLGARVHDAPADVHLRAPAASADQSCRSAPSRRQAERDRCTTPSPRPRATRTITETSSTGPACSTPATTPQLDYSDRRDRHYTPATCGRRARAPA